MMLMTEETMNKFNALLTESFLLNMKLDNMVYQIDYEAYVNIAPIVHENMAHVSPRWADELSDFMIKMDAKPIRGDLHSEYVNYGEDLAQLFADMAGEIDGYRRKVIELIEIAEFNEDVEVKIFLENFLLEIVPYHKQARIWAKYAERYQNDYKSFDVHFADVTTFIDVK